MICHQGNAKDTTIQLLEGSTCKTMTTSNAGYYVEQQELSFIAGGNSKYTLEDSSAISCKTKHTQHAIQQLHLSKLTQSSTLMSMQKPAHGCLL